MNPGDLIGFRVALFLWGEAVNGRWRAMMDGGLGGLGVLIDPKDGLAGRGGIASHVLSPEKEATWLHIHVTLWGLSQSGAPQAGCYWPGYSHPCAVIPSLAWHTQNTAARRWHLRGWVIKTGLAQLARLHG